MKMQLVLRYLLLVFVFIFSVSAPVSAHFPVSDGDYILEFHLDPNDSPVAGTTSRLFFTLVEYPSNFDWDACTCTLIISKNKKDYVNEVLKRMRYSYIFPEAGIYRVAINATPKKPGAFTPFNVSYDYRVNPGPSNKKDNSTLLFAVGIIALIMGIGIIIYKRNE